MKDNPGRSAAKQHDPRSVQLTDFKSFKQSPRDCLKDSDTLMVAQRWSSLESASTADDGTNGG